jgi:PAS domain S-box-containing protein
MKKTNHQSQFARLRAKAEELLKTRTEIPAQNNPESDIIKLVSELEVYQIELEMQNEELALAKQRAGDAAEMFAKLYDFAPVAYFTLSKEGEILQLNLNGATLIGKGRSQLLKARFGFFVSEDTKSVFNTFLENVFSNNVKQLCDVTIVRDSKERLIVQLIGIVNENSEECFISAVDITERVKAEEKLNESKEKYKKLSLLKKAILESPGGIIFFALDNEYRYLDFSKHHQRTMKEIWGVDIKVGTNMLHLIINDQDREKAKYNFDKALKGESFVVEEVYGDEKLKRTFYENRYSPFCNDDNSIRGLTVFVIDITERKQAEEALRESEENFRKMFHEHTAIMMLIDPSTGIILDANLSAVKFYGYAKSVLCSMNISALNCLPEDKVRAELKYAIKHRNNDFTILHKLSNGNVRIVEVHSSPIDHQGKSILFSIILNITDRIRSEVLLKDERLRLQGIIEGTNVGTWEWNIQTEEVAFNKKWYEMIGYLPEELFPVSIKTWETLTHPDDLKRSAVILEQHFKGERLYYSCECRMKHKDGSWVWILDRGRVITRTADGKPLKMFGTHTDITQQKYEEEERERMIAALQSALVEVKTLSGIIPICANCKKVRDDKGYWEQVESYVSHHTNAQFSHGVCPDCVEKLYPEQVERLRNKQKK